MNEQVKHDCKPVVPRHTGNHRISIAPMLDWTDRHYRYMARLISRHQLLYTEMVTTGAIIHGKGDYLRYNEQEHPISLQLGGSNPADMALCAQKAQQYGYDEVNINVGCPSDRVQNGMFGACLMAQPKLVAECVDAMRSVVDIPVTVKHRIGIDNLDSYQFMTDFVGEVSEAGCESFIIHARKAWLSGLSPKQNREVPPLDYERVHQLKQDFSQLDISINGGIVTLEQAAEHLQHVDGVMIGREAYQNPYILAEVDRLFYQDDATVLTRHQVVEKMMEYIEQHLIAGGRINHITRHMLNLFVKLPGAKMWRRHLSENAHKPGADVRVIEQALTFVEAPD
ncbi:MAG: tRNA dihydrouridine(20/20a) synthase DusA [Gammaproteobacteria bacterium]|nr:tRNA dihydrouridine(20/20a) synthase DusA [Gammaproteobacteria bacterium]